VDQNRQDKIKISSTKIHKFQIKKGQDQFLLLKVKF